MGSDGRGLAIVLDCVDYIRAHTGPLGLSYCLGEGAGWPSDADAQSALRCIANAPFSNIILFACG